MFKTGNISIDSFSQLVALLPLLPALIVFIRGIYRKEVLNFLMILCLLYLLENFTMLPDNSAEERKAVLHLVFVYLQLVAFIQIFKTVLSLHSKYLLYGITFLYGCILVTYFLSAASFHYIHVTDILSNTLVLVACAMSLNNAIKLYDLQIFNQPIFWITTGSLFYLFISILVEISMVDKIANGTVMPDAMALLDIANVVRYVFYCLAAIYYLPQQQQKNSY